MPNFYTGFDSIVFAEQWFPGRPVTGVMQPHFGSMTKFKPYITLTNIVCGEITVHVLPGDWIARAQNETFVIKDSAFKTMHRPVDDEAAIALGFSNLVEYESNLPTISKQNNA